jgi:hypothetical protein
VKYFKYLKYLLKHKWYVFVECVHFGIPIRGLLHDLSKFLPDEFFPYCEYFYGKGKNEREFDIAWLKHQHRNPHHYQYWQLKKDDGDLIFIRMPDRYYREMLADWTGAGKAIKGYQKGHDELVEWFTENKEKIVKEVNQETADDLEFTMHCFRLGYTMKWGKPCHEN